MIGFPGNITVRDQQNLFWFSSHECEYRKSNFRKSFSERDFSAMKLDDPFYRVETDQLWHSMESLFAAALWAPQTIPKIKTHVSYNNNAVKDGLYEELDIS